MTTQWQKPNGMTRPSLPDGTWVEARNRAGLIQIKLIEHISWLRYGVPSDIIEYRVVD